LTRVARDAPAAAKIAEGLFRLRLDAFRDSTRGRADAGRPGAEDESVGDDRLAV